MTFDAKSEEVFSRLANANAIGVFVVSNGVVRHANDALLSILGRTRAELEAGTLSRAALVAEGVRDLAAEAPAEPSRARGARYEVECVRPDGSRVPVLVAVTAIEPDVYAGLVVDISLQRNTEAALKRSEARFRAAAEGFDAFVILEAVRDERGRIIDFRYVELNSHAAERVGKSREQLLGRTLTEVIPGPQIRAYIAKYVPVVETRVGLEEDLAIDVPGLKRRWVSMHVVPLEDGVAITSRDISQRHADEQERKNLVSFLDSIIENVPAMIFVKNAETLRFERINRTGEELYGRSKQHIVGKTNQEIFPQPQADYFEKTDRAVLETGNTFTAENRLETPSGTRWIHSKKMALRDSSGAAKHLLGISVDITEVKTAEAALKGFEVLFRQSPLGILISSAEGVIIDVNHAAVALLGFDREELIGRTSADVGLVSASAREQSFEVLRSEGGVRDLAMKITVKSRESRDVMVSNERVDLAGETRFITTFMDVTALKRAEESLREAALIDELTGLSNRRGFLMLGEQQLKMTKRRGDLKLALMFIDLDGLKKVNDSLGHKVGDELIREAAKLLRRTFRESDVIARLGGDEFAILATWEASKIGDIRPLLEERLQTHNRTRSRELALAMSVGISVVEAGDSLEDVLADADRKMYVVKQERARFSLNPQ